MIALPVFRTIDEAWVEVLRLAEKPSDGRLLHVVLAITEPGAAQAAIVNLNNDLLSSKDNHPVDRVASTIFPSNLYLPPAYDYHPHLAVQDLHELDAAARDLYACYREMLPELCQFPGNGQGTYFGRLVSWPGNDSNGYNQLERRVAQIRARRDLGDSATNAADLALEGIAELESFESEGLGLQIYKSNDERTQGFPCLVHLDISVVAHKLHLTAIYRHWHLINKAYGNLVGLSRLLHFLAQQTGYEPGELMVHATVANAQTKLYGHTRLRQLIEEATDQLQPASAV